MPGFGASRAREPVDFVIERLPVQTRDGVPRAELHIFAVIADGLLQRFPELTSVSKWQVNDQWSAKYTDPTDDPATQIRVHARTLTLGMWSCPNGGRVRITAGSSIVERDLAGDWTPVWLDIPDLVAPYSATSFAVLLLLTLAAFIQPWRGGRRATIWLVLHLSLLHFLYWGSQPIAASGDTRGYFDSLGIFAHGQPSYYPPGYPLFLGLCQLLTDHVGALATLLQHGMFVACFVGLFAMMRAVFFEEAAFVVCLLGGSLLPGLATPQMAISEPLATIGMGVGLYFAWAAHKHPSAWRSILAGILIGWAGLTRVVPMAAALPAVAMICLFPWRKRRVLVFGQCVAASAAVVLASMVWTWSQSGRPQLSDGTPAHLFNHFITYQRLLDENGPRTRELQALVGGRELRGTAHWDVSPVMAAHGYSHDECLRLLGDVAWEAAATASLMQHAACILELAWLELIAEPFQSAPDKPWVTERLPEIENPTCLGVTSRSLQFFQALKCIHLAIWPVLVWLFVLGLLLAPFLHGRLVLLAIGWLAVGYLLVTSCVEYFLERYNVAVFPFVVVIAGVPLILVAQLLARIRVRLTLVSMGRVRLPLPALSMLPRRPAEPD